ncbi:hypothetical protein LTR86_002348 [Recurvomyces mirabilis]|nr:hypothetical protein LTR86_002348 [Recurvomyces mirabilis]
MDKPNDRIYLHIDYEDAYVQPLIIAAIRSRLPPELLVFIQGKDLEQLPANAKYLQWRQYEQIDFEHLLDNPSTSLANSYIIRKALIRKHYLSTTISHWLTKNPDSVLKDHVKPSVEFEVDYAEFLDDALIEAWELKESWARDAAIDNEGECEDGKEKEWWILKPGMSERGQGIRLFSSEEELTAIFEEWDPPSDDEDGDEDHEERTAHSGEGGGEDRVPKPTDHEDEGNNGIMTSQLRHFIAQPYIHPPLLLPSPHPSADRKFHIRTYVVAAGALKVYVYQPMLALFAGKDYTSPGSATGEREGSVDAFWDLPSTLPNLNTAENTSDWRQDVFEQICAATGETFEAAARTMSIHFQPLPNSFEIFGLDFLVDAQGTAWLLEVNAFPDFKQTGDELSGLVEGLFEGVVDVAVRPFFGVDGVKQDSTEMIKVLDIDLGRR